MSRGEEGFPMVLEQMTRSEMEVEVLEYDILPTDEAGIHAILKMTDEELREAIRAWILAGDEAAS